MTTRVRIRRARPADADALGDVHVRVWRWAYRGLVPDDLLDGMRADRRAARWRSDLAADRFATWVAEERGAIVGFAGAADTRDDEVAGTAIPEMRMRKSIDQDGTGRRSRS